MNPERMLVYLSREHPDAPVELIIGDGDHSCRRYPLDAFTLIGLAESATIYALQNARRDRFSSLQTAQPSSAVSSPADLRRIKIVPVSGRSATGTSKA